MGGKRMNYKELMHTKTYDEMTEEELAFCITTEIDYYRDKVNKLREEDIPEYKISAYIYDLWQDYLIADAFKKEFPNRVIENKRHYFNDNFEKNALDRISQVHFERENDDYLKMLEYISSINIVSRCDCLVTGLNGGSEMAIYRNGNQYKYMYVFDKGVY